MPSPPGDLPDLGIEPICLVSCTGRQVFVFVFVFVFFFKPLEPPGKPQFSVIFPCHCIGDVMLWGCEGPGSILEFCVLMIRFQVYYGSRDFGLCSSQMFPSSLCEAGRLEGVGIGYFLSP